MLKTVLYSIEDKLRCLEIFDSNLDIFFDSSERDDFAQFLDSPDCEFFVFFRDKVIVACGGYYVSKENIGSLCWGMVDRHLHKRKIGLEMTSLRIKKMSEKGVKKILMDTSQKSVGFYQKLGFEITEKIKNGYGKNLDRIDLKLELGNDARKNQ